MVTKGPNEFIVEIAKASNIIIFHLLKLALSVRKSSETV